MAQQRAQLRKAPTERRARVSRGVPQKFAKVFPPPGPVGQRQVGEQAAGFSRRGQCTGDAVCEDGKLAQQPYGGVLLGVVAAGLAAYGLFCFVQARYRRI